MRNHLDSSAKVISSAFLGDDVGVDPAGREIIVPGQVTAGTDEPLIVAQVKVCLGTICSDVNLAMLQWAHRSRIHIDIRIEFEHGDIETAGFENRPERGGSDAFPERGNYTTSNKNKARHRTPI